MMNESFVDVTWYILCFRIPRLSVNLMNTQGESHLEAVFSLGFELKTGKNKYCVQL
jgi:hypothetical protein